MTEEKTKPETGNGQKLVEIVWMKTGNGQKLVEIVWMNKELNKENERRHTLEERLNIKYKELRQRLEKAKKENERIETTLDNL